MLFLPFLTVKLLVRNVHDGVHLSVTVFCRLLPWNLMLDLYQ
jgi:hypothetical protein